MAKIKLIKQEEQQYPKLVLIMELNPTNLILTSQFLESIIEKSKKEESKIKSIFLKKQLLTLN